ncbi:EthD family reductase [Oryzomonas rubra]|uniref:EthD family reductase n=1 Tax=Oryzomonas rubra TaxID=2509454 RepID=A0A5A9X5T1_9BACT|nr:EthD family reductase [Oryzomonas rubra]KAA0888366.1 EthD family reductase [Oryzomonas rubra]
MVKVSVLYPNDEGPQFNMDYYCNRHVPMFQEKLGAACKMVSIDQGLGGNLPNTKASFVAMGHFCFDSEESFQNAFAPHAEFIMADIANFTNIQPTAQISEVKLFLLR